MKVLGTKEVEIQELYKKNTDQMQKEETLVCNNQDLKERIQNVSLSIKYFILF